MKQIFGQYGIIIIAVFFIAVFAAFLSYSVSYNKAINVKNEIVNLLERSNGFNPTVHNEINEFLSSVGYRTNGDCNASNTEGEGQWNGYSMNNTNEQILGDANFCIRAQLINGNSPEVPNNVIYHVKIFYRMNIPILSEILNLEIIGITKRIVVGF